MAVQSQVLQLPTAKPASLLLTIPGTFLFAIAVSVIWFACDTNKTPSYTINAEIVGPEDATLIYLQQVADGKMEVIDSAYLENSQVSFTGVMEQPEMIYLKTYSPTTTRSCLDLSSSASLFEDITGEIVTYNTTSSINPKKNIVMKTSRFSFSSICFIMILKVKNLPLKKNNNLINQV